MLYAQPTLPGTYSHKQEQDLIDLGLQLPDRELLLRQRLAHLESHFLICLVY